MKFLIESKIVLYILKLISLYILSKSKKMSYAKTAKEILDSKIKTKKRKLRKDLEDGVFVLPELKEKKDITFMDLFKSYRTIKTLTKEKEIKEELEKIFDVESCNMDELEAKFNGNEDYVISFTVLLRNAHKMLGSWVGINHNSEQVLLSSLRDYFDLVNIEENDDKKINHFKHNIGRYVIINPNEPADKQVKEFVYDVILPKGVFVDNNVKIEEVEEEYNRIEEAVIRILHNNMLFKGNLRAGNNIEILYKLNPSSKNTVYPEQEYPEMLKNIFDCYSKVYDNYMNFIRSVNVRKVFDKDLPTEMIKEYMNEKDDEALKRINYSRHGLSSVRNIDDMLLDGFKRNNLGGKKSRKKRIKNKRKSIKIKIDK